jgi:pSer/pThr/pTyr-binding forkhead associated (FHA) protein
MSEQTPAKPNTPAAGTPIRQPAATLTVTRPPLMSGRSIVIDASDTVIGRDSGCDFVLDSPNVSRRHAVVHFRDKQYLLEDLGSTNGTLLNGELVLARRVLCDGDRLTFADVEVKFQLAASSPLVLSYDDPSDSPTGELPPVVIPARPAPTYLPSDAHYRPDGDYYRKADQAYSQPDRDKTLLVGAPREYPASVGRGDPGGRDLRQSAPATQRPKRRRRSKERPPGQKPFATQESAVDRLVAEAVRTTVVDGRLLFNPPDTMRQGAAKRVEVAIARSLNLDHVLRDRLRGPGEPQIETISTSPFMAVRLTGIAFSVSRLTPVETEEQLVAPTARWEFDVLPLRSGEHQLLLSVTLRIPFAGRSDERIAVPVLERTIKVRVDPVYGGKQFVGKNWQWIAATSVGLGGAITAWVKVFN